MAKRNVLHISKLEDLKKWLVGDGWELLSLSNNPYEVLRASKAGKQNPLIIYLGKSSEHLSFAERDMPVIGAFLRDKKKPQTNADRIRSMTDEELLDFLCSIETYEQGSVKTIEGGVAMCSVTDVEQWLRAESEG
ncbi:MAG: hypothetical protein ACLS6A_12060 [Roseburia intestinalis]